MQATVATFDPQGRSGTVLLDDGAELAFGETAFAASRFRMLRPGQRVVIDRDASGQVLRLTLPGLD